METWYDILRWFAVVVCLSQSAMFSGLNLAFFSLGRLRLEAEAEQGSEGALKILGLRKDSNFLLSTILWGNVGANVALTQLLTTWGMADGGKFLIAAFLISTFGITFFGEIMPQAYFSRHALKVASKLAPIIRLYQVLLYPVAKPSALVLDGWIGPEGPNFMRERDIEIILHKHIHEENSEIGETEGQGALNFLDLDDRKVVAEGQEIDPGSIHAFPVRLDLPTLPRHSEEGFDAFIEELKKNDKKWRIIIDEESDDPLLVLDAEAYVFGMFSEEADLDIYEFCHRPIVVTDPMATLDQVLAQLEVEAEHRDDLVVDDDVILYWNDDERRIITGADILGRLLKGIVQQTLSGDDDTTTASASKVEALPTLQVVKEEEAEAAVQAIKG